MIDALKKMMGLAPSPDFAELVKQGATILDVRTMKEYSRGHIHGSLNIPVDQLQNNMDRLPDRAAIIITCCASGVRSGSAKNILKANGFDNVHNGGSWDGLQQKI